MRISRNPCFLRWRWIVLSRNDWNILSKAWGSCSMVSKRATKIVALGVILAGTLLAESRKEYHFAVGPKAGVSVMNPYVSIWVEPCFNTTFILNPIMHPY